MDAKGGGVPEKNILANAWWNLARLGDSKSAEKNREIHIPQMTEEQISKAQKLATEWYEAHQAKE